ncbi:MAG TPA: VCBS repeat-containing protein [Phycisphaerae bacterium]|jgi:hypothetical protein
MKSRSTTRIAIGALLLTVLAAVIIAAGCANTFTSSGASEQTTLTGTTLRNTGPTQSFFTAVQVDPRSEDSAGPQVVVAGDLDGDGLLDLVSGWNQSQPLQIHLQRRDERNNITFETVTLAGNIPIALIADLAVADFDSDGHNDIAVLVKDTGDTGLCRMTGQPVSGSTGAIVIYYGPADARDVTNPLAWVDVQLMNSFVQGSAGASGSEAVLPEDGGYTAVAVGDLDGVNGPDMVVTFNAGGCDGNLREVDAYYNPGSAGARRSGEWTPTPLFQGIPGDPNAITIKDVALADIDRDGDLDVLTTIPGANARNVSWFRNPQLDAPDDFHISDGEWHMGVIGQISSGADVLAVGDIDQDGIVDVAIRSTTGLLIQWLKGAQFPTTEPVRSIPWHVFTLAEFRDRAPEALALGDVSDDGRIDAVVSAGGAIVWFNGRSAANVYDPWAENLIVDENPGGGTASAASIPSPPPTNGNSANANGSAPTTQPASGGTTTGPTSGSAGSGSVATLINALLIVDLDGDGDRDIIATLDRRQGSGLTNDALIWYRNDLRALAAP